MIRFQNKKTVEPAEFLDTFAFVKDCGERSGRAGISKGFTFAEVLLALFVLATSMYLLSNLQFRSLMKVSDGREEIERVFLIKKALYELFLDPILKKKDKQIVEKLEKPEVVITSHNKAIDKKKSVLKDFAEDIDIIWAEGTWKSGMRNRRSKMISFVFKEKKQESSDEK